MLPIVVTIKDANGNPVGGEGVTLKRVQAKSRSGISVSSNTVDDLILDEVTPDIGAYLLQPEYVGMERLHRQ